MSYIRCKAGNPVRGNRTSQSVFYNLKKSLSFVASFSNRLCPSWENILQKKNHPSELNVYFLMIVDHIAKQAKSTVFTAGIFQSNQSDVCSYFYIHPPTDFIHTFTHTNSYSLSLSLQFLQSHTHFFLSHSLSLYLTYSIVIIGKGTHTYEK